MNITNEIINEFEKELMKEEKSPATIEKYIRDVKTFYDFAVRLTEGKGAPFGSCQPLAD